MRSTLALLALPLHLGLLLSGCARDRDQDGFSSKEDCNDANAAVNPEAAELCNDLDDDCDGTVDEDAGDAWYLDADADGHGDPEQVLAACEEPQGYVLQGDDCDDSDDRFHPGASETDCADPNDYNCDQSVGYADVDGDEFAACEDCDDGNAAAFPGAAEVCDEADNDCDQLVDAQDPDIEGAGTWYLDYDADGYGGTLSEASCSALEGYVDNSADCDDLDPTSYPEAEELCDGADNDCDTAIDEDSAELQTFYADADADGYGDPEAPVTACAQPEGSSRNDLDCADGDPLVSPAADEQCDGIDNDCDSLADDLDSDTLYGAEHLWYGDGDGDGYGSPDDVALACLAPDGRVGNPDDCDDEDLAVNPGAVETCDGVDNDCDEGADEASAVDATAWYLDEDEDGFGLDGSRVMACVQLVGTTDVPGDCVDEDPEIRPDAVEQCNDGVDNDCDPDAAGCELSLADADLTLLGEIALDDAGVALSGAGDIDGDGADDLLVGARNSDGAGADAGAAYLVFGPLGPGGAVSLGSSGLVFEGGDAGDKFGRELASGRDFDGDGRNDVVISAPSDEAGATSAGAAYLFSGADLGTSGSLGAAAAASTWLGETAYDYLGVNVRGGELSGDGQADLLISATGDDDGGTEAGSVYLLAGPMPTGTVDFGAGGSAHARILGENAADGMGQVLSAEGDLDGDGQADLLIGVAREGTAGASAGALYLLAGPLSGLIDLGDADAKVLGGAAGDQLGAAVAALGDQDFDGIDDLAVGASLQDDAGADAGAIYVLGGMGSLVDLDGFTVGSLAMATLRGEAGGDQLGASLAEGGDFDGDGVLDLAGGAQVAGGTGEGAAYLFLGPVTADRGALDADGVFRGEAAGDAAGGVLGYGGDLSGSGTDALLVAARGSDRAGTDAGALYLIFDLGL